MPSIAVISPKGGVGKSTIAECLRQAYKKAQVVDMDHQKTLTVLATINQKPLPLNNYDLNTERKETITKYIIYDTPPYNDEALRELIRIADRVIVPIKGGPSDLAAFPSVYESLKKTNAYKKALVVFNEVRRPITKIHKRIVSIFHKNFPKVKVAKTYLSNLNAFKKALFSTLEGEALKQINFLIKELDI